MALRAARDAAVFLGVWLAAWPSAMASPGAGACQSLAARLPKPVDDSRQAPKDAEIGVSVFYQDPTGSHAQEAGWHPVPESASRGKMVNVLALSAEQPLPEVFLIGDGSLRRAFMYVDSRAGSPLATIVGQMIGKIPGVDHGRVNDLGKVLEFIQTDLASLVDNRWRLGEDGVGDNPWDPRNFQLTPEARGQFDAAGKAGPKDPYLATNERFPVVPFEAFLQDTVSAYCIQKVMLAKILLDRLGIPARMIPGAVITRFTNGNFVTEGHMWLELPSYGDRPGPWYLDPTHKSFGPVGEPNPTQPDWIWYPAEGYYRRPNNQFPVMVPFR